MATAEQVAAAHYRRQVALSRRIAGEAARLWRTIAATGITASWDAGVGLRLLALVTGAQALVATDADRYLTEVLVAQNIAPAAEGAVNPRAFAGIASDGRPLASLLYQPVDLTLYVATTGVGTQRAMATGLLHLDMIVRTQLADAGRAAVSAGMVARRNVGGYVRMLNPPSCSRCAVLAGKWFRWNQGFQRHPRCDCRHIPTREDLADDLRTDPKAYFDSLSKAEQDRVFTQAGAAAVRDGADVSQVVNARRGMATAGVSKTRVNAQGLVVNERHKTQATEQVFGREVHLTREGITRRGLAGARLIASPTGNRGVRLMPEQLYLEAGGDRDETIRLLKRFGYIL